MSRLKRDSQVEALVAAYRADLEAAGQYAENEVTSPACRIRSCVNQRFIFATNRKLGLDSTLRSHNLATSGLRH